VGGFSLLIDVEVTSESEANEAIDAGADIVMLDNMTGQDLIDVATRLREKWSGKRKFLLETSGGIDESNLHTRAINGSLHSSSPFCPCRSTIFSD
jgi:nicotinate-nucleotide pyrophosphorylase (carboxylating)